MLNNQTVDEYIALYSPDVQLLLQKVRQTIQAAAPDAVEKISYGIPTYFEGENIIHFGGSKHHIGLYPSSSGIEAFADRLKNYKTSKGAIQFSYHSPIPYDLIAEITTYRVLEAKRRQKSTPTKAQY